MRSFGLWYKKKTNKLDEPVFSVHVNFWSESVKKGSRIPDLDIGIKITSFYNVNEMVFHCPFQIKDHDVYRLSIAKDNTVIKDLVPKLYKKDTANIIFNTDGEVATRESYSIYSFEKYGEEENLILFPIKQDIDDIVLLNQEDGKSDIIFVLSEFNSFLEQKETFSDINEVYIRFRITSEQLNNNIYFDCVPTNKSFESAFSGTRIFDFKINEKRNLGSKTITGIERGGYEFPTIENIHLLVMEPSTYDVESFANPQMTCRELERKLWDDYYDSKINYSKGRILA